MRTFSIIAFLFLLLSEQPAAAQADCNCAKTALPQKYKAKVDNGENVPVCSECAALALYLCLCDCKTTTSMTRQQIETSIATIKETLESYQDLDMYCCDELLKNIKLNCPNAGTVKTTPNNNSRGTGNGSSENFPEGWSFIRDYQSLLNEYVDEFNRVANGADVSKLMKLAERLQLLLERNAALLAKLTKAQMDALDKLTQFFTDAMLQQANAQMVKLSRVHYAEEAERQQNSFISDIQTTPTRVSNEGTKPTGTPNQDNTLGNGNGMLRPDDPKDDMGTKGKKRK